MSRWPSLADDLASLGSPPGGRPARVALTSYEFVGPVRNGGIGTACTALARALAADGHEVDLVFTGWPEDRSDAFFDVSRRRYEELGIRLERIDLESTRGYDSVLYNTAHSLALYEHLRRRDEERPYDVIHFVESLGHGLYSLMAKHEGLAFQQATTVVGVHSPRRWLAEAHGAPFTHPIELGDEFMERTCIELADVVLAPSAHMLDWLEGTGYRLPERSLVQQYVTDFPPAPAGNGMERVEELVFFGRLEPRKGLATFCDALDELAERHAGDLRITFLGKEVDLGRVWSGEFVRERARVWPWPCRVTTDLDRDEALAYVGAPGRLAVMASVMDNSPNTVYEALGLGIPFLASRGGGTGELVHPDDFERVTYDPADPETLELDPADPSALRPAHTGAVLADRLERALGTPVKPARFAVEPEGNRKAHVDWHRAVAGSRPPPPAEAPAPPPVSLCLTEEVERQDHPGCEVVVSASRDEAAARARHDLLVFVEGDFDFSPRLASTLAQAAAAFPDAGFLVGLGSFDGQVGDELLRRPFLPAGGPAVTGLVGNCFGAGAVLAQRAALERVGGVGRDLAPTMELYELLARAALAGEVIGVVPEWLFHRPAATRPLTSPPDPLRAMRPYYSALPPEVREMAGVARHVGGDWSAAQLRAELAQQHAAEVAAELDVVLRSRSLKLTAPLRRSGELARRIRGR